MGEMAQWLGVLIGVPEDRGSISSTHMTNDYNSNPVFWPLQALPVCGAQAYTKVKHLYT